MSASPAELAARIVAALEEKKAQEIALLDVREQVSYADYLVISSGTSGAHVHSLVSALRGLEGDKSGPVYACGSKDDSWWILDFVDVVVHVFKPESRAFYDLENFWCDAKKIPV